MLDQDLKLFIKIHTPLKPKLAYIFNIFNSSLFHCVHIKPI